MKKLILLVFTLNIVACASPDFNYRPQSTQISEPPLETVNTAYIGDVMVRQGRYIEHESIFVKNKIDIGWAYDLHPGYYLKKGEDKKTVTYYPGGGDEAGDVQKRALADPWKAVMVYKGEDKICVITAFNVRSCEKNTNFERRKKPILTSDSFQQTLIYSGKIGNKINIGYREFSNSMARPAFNNDVEYDLNSSRVIGYKGARLEVVEATNEYIKYKVLRNFNNTKI